MSRRAVAPVEAAVRSLRRRLAPRAERTTVAEEADVDGAAIDEALEVAARRRRDSLMPLGKETRAAFKKGVRPAAMDPLGRLFEAYQANGRALAGLDPELVRAAGEHARARVKALQKRAAAAKGREGVNTRRRLALQVRWLERWVEMTGVT